ncbi:hypothetical protein Vqi01_42320 [Micromonospora qiuiae]|uniref:PPM-type phosphatase domain-containing protein n=1 Tax=Micromonospora qiuiae TaxID=502268 RepID=A0ABQ4JHY8_9ACTN|nr:hypothetical protein Vqi01_42320 [Micromonospora qiuiae]
MRAAVRSCTAPGRARRGPDEASGAVGADLHVDAVALVLSDGLWSATRPIGIRVPARIAYVS